MHPQSELRAGLAGDLSAGFHDLCGSQPPPAVSREQSGHVQSHLGLAHALGVCQPVSCSAAHPVLSLQVAQMRIKMPSEVPAVLEHPAAESSAAYPKHTTCSQIVWALNWPGLRSQAGPGQPSTIETCLRALGWLCTLRRKEIIHLKLLPRL